MEINTINYDNYSMWVFKKINNHHDVFDGLKS